MSSIAAKVAAATAIAIAAAIYSQRSRPTTVAATVAYYYQRIAAALLALPHHVGSFERNQTDMVHAFVYFCCMSFAALLIPLPVMPMREVYSV
jgi:hypothetical protein